MNKLFDYKFLITLGLSLVVYFLYREVDILNKRIASLEKGEKNINKQKKLIELPPPPNNDNDLVEEYSNEEIEHKDNINIYSHDNLETNSNEHDSLMVDSILNMVRAETPNKKTSSSSKNSTHSDNSEESEHLENTRLSRASSVSSISSNSSKSSKISNSSISTRLAEMIKSNNTTEENNDDNIELVKNVVSLDALNKKKLDELQDLASKYNIDINNENGKKKKKADLAQEIFNKQ